jgi:hypothetical protein
MKSFMFKLECPHIHYLNIILNLIAERDSKQHTPKLTKQSKINKQQK